MQGKSVTVTLGLENGQVRHFNGHVFEFQFIHGDGGVARYRMVLRPWMAYLRLRHDCWLFHGQDLLSQAEEIFRDYPGIAHWRSEPGGTLPAITQSCQHNETDFNYLSRHWEAAGLHYRYEHTRGRHTLILSGSTLTAGPIGGGGTAVLQEDSHPDGAGTIARWSPARRIVPGTLVLSGYNFKNPRPVRAGTRNLQAQGAVEPVEHYGYAGTYPFKDSAGAAAQACLRMEEFQCRAKTIEGQGSNRHLETGKSLRLAGRNTGRSEAWNTY